MSDADVGFFDGDGGWVTVSEAEEQMADKVDVPIRDALEQLEEIGVVNVRRDDDGEIVTAQASETAIQLYKNE